MEAASTPLAAKGQGGRAAGWRADARAWLSSHGTELWIVAGLWAVITLVIFWLATGHESPRRYQDEFLFWALAKNFANGDGLVWRGVGLNMKSWLYPVLLAPGFWFTNSIQSAYTAVQLINSMMIVGTIFPAFLMARMYLERWTAVLAALMAVSVPAMNYAGIIGTENLGYLVCTAAFAAILLAATQPRPRNWALALGFIFVAALTRTQFVILLPIFIGVVLLAGAMRGPGARGEYFRAQKWLLIGSGALFALALLVLLVQGRAAVGIYAGVFEGIPLTWDATKYWVKAFTADVFLLTGILPTIATFAMFGGKENRRDPLIGALLALALLASLAFIAQVAWFSATNPYGWRDRHIFYERYMFYLGPIFFTGFLAAWKRVSVGSAVVAVSLSTVVVSGFQSDAILVPFSYDSFGLSLVGWYVDAHQDMLASIGSKLALLTLLLGVIYIVSTLPKESVARIGRLVGVMLVLAMLIGTQAKTWQYARLFSHDAFKTFPRPASFIDENTDEDVGMIVTSTDAPEMYFQTEFWNDRIVRAFATESKPIETPIMYSPTCEFDWTRTGEILGTGCDKVPNAWFMRSDTVSMHLKDETKRVHPSPSWPSLTLMEGEPPPRILSLVDGRDVRNGNVSGVLNARTFLDRAGELRVRVQATSGVRELTVGDTLPVRIPGGREGIVTIAIPRNDHSTAISMKSNAGLPQPFVVTQLEVREPRGKWISIR